MISCFLFIFTSRQPVSTTAAFSQRLMILLLYSATMMPQRRARQARRQGFIGLGADLRSFRSIGTAAFIAAHALSYSFAFTFNASAARRSGVMKISPIFIRLQGLHGHDCAPFSARSDAISTGLIKHLLLELLCLRLLLHTAAAHSHVGAFFPLAALSAVLVAHDAVHVTTFQKPAAIKGGIFIGDD